MSFSSIKRTRKGQSQSASSRNNLSWRFKCRRYQVKVMRSYGSRNHKMRVGKPLHIIGDRLSLNKSLTTVIREMKVIR